MELIIVPTEVSEAQAQINRCHCKLVEAVFMTVCELFELQDSNISYQIDHDTISFCNTYKREGDFEYAVVSESKKRSDIEKMEAGEISRWVIDSILHRDKWTIHHRYMKLEFPPKDI